MKLRHSQSKLILGLIFTLYLKTLPLCAADIYQGWSTFSTLDHPKARGLHIVLRHPPHWRSQEGRQNQVVQSFKGEDDEKGIGYAVLAIGARTIPGPVLSALDIDDDYILDLVTELGGKYIESGHTLIDGEHAAWVVFTESRSNQNIQAEMMTLMYVILHNREWVQCQFSVGGISRDKTIGQRFIRYRPLFEKIGNSIVFPKKHRSTQEVPGSDRSEIIDAFLSWYYSQSTATKLTEAGVYFDMIAICSRINRKYNLSTRAKWSQQDTIDVLSTSFFNPFREVKYEITSVDRAQQPGDQTLFKYRLRVLANRFELAPDMKAGFRHLYKTNPNAARLMAQQNPNIERRHIMTADSFISFLERMSLEALNAESNIQQHFLVDNKSGKIVDWSRPAIDESSAFDDQAELFIRQLNSAR